ncbi:hypothetical protein [Kribbella sp. CA-293567]|uniref:hypothetical protein n=1 Tax=Kribbella sp. CA-293567 TaxID=3002436 RepID=UPI0022DE96A9|nr:hypothetical protein [Kribbella sp. CA-293567]WBQ05494.1 hypothetical protein OX958_01545 [Kribbella sp. CA-293567]
MTKSQRALRLTAQISLLLALAATSAFLLLRTYLTDNDKVFRQGEITEVVQQGPVTIGEVQWKLESLEVYTQLVNAEKKKVDLEQPAGSVVIVAKASVTPLDGVKMSDSGFTCAAKLRDDRGNVWKPESPYGLGMPTNCSDSDFPFTRNKPGQVAQIFVVPESAVKHLSGIQVEDLTEFRRVLMTR